jgi:hypothetical protein
LRDITRNPSRKLAMADANERPDTFLWALRGLTTLFLFGYLLTIFLAVFLGNQYPSGKLAGDLAAAGLLVLFGIGYILMWSRRELLAGILFIAWYAALWIVYLSTGDERFRDTPAFGIILLILGILFLVYRAGARGRQRKAGFADMREGRDPGDCGNQGAADGTGAGGDTQ